MLYAFCETLAAPHVDPDPLVLTLGRVGQRRPPVSRLPVDPIDIIAAALATDLGARRGRLTFTFILATHDHPNLLAKSLASRISLNNVLLHPHPNIGYSDPSSFLRITSYNPHRMSGVR